LVGNSDGLLEGSVVGCFKGEFDGILVGNSVGPLEGLRVGFLVGAIDGALDGNQLGCTDGGRVGIGVGLEVVGVVVPLQEPTTSHPSFHKTAVDPGSYPKVPHE